MISILMASHNANELFFKECMDSIFAQTYQDFEIVIVDDGSDFPVSQLVHKLKYEDERIRIVRSDVNLGLPKALNYGLKNCLGEYIARMDDDDIMSSSRLEEQLKYLKENEQFIGCFSWFDRINSKGEYVRTEEIQVSPNKFLKTLLSKGNIFCHSSVFVKKEALDAVGGYDENLRYAQDCDLYIRLLEKYNIGIVSKSLLKFRINNYRTNKYRDCLSLTYSYFGVARYICLNPNSSKVDYFYFFQRTLRFLIGCVRIAKAKN